MLVKMNNPKFVRHAWGFAVKQKEAPRRFTTNEVFDELLATRYTIFEELKNYFRNELVILWKIMKNSKL